MFGLDLLALAQVASNISTSNLSSSPPVVSSKRGLIGVDNVNSFRDHPTLLAGPALSWAMNYGTQPGNSSWFGTLEFVPQLWGANDASSFQEDVLANVPATKHIYAFNEPDGTGPGQATMSPAEAAATWQKYVEPLKAHNISLGSPACTGTDGGIQWMKEFYGNCSDCTVDFLTTHWYGSFEGLAAHIGNIYNVFNGTPIWITELAIAGAPIDDTVYMFNTSVHWLDSLSWVDRYAWFGSFRSSESNIGPNATFLNANGNLTSIGQEYLYDLAATATDSSATASATGIASQPASSSTSARSSGIRTQYVAPLSITVTGMAAAFLVFT